MERQTEGKATFPPFAQQLIDRGMREGELKGMREGRREGELKGKRDALLRLLARAGIALTEDDRARIQACSDAATLDHWIDNVLGAKTAADVLS
jgi:predicted transposase YdaD